MRFGNWRGVTLAAGLLPALVLAVGLASTPARAQDFHTIPRLVPAIDLNTGGPYYAPPVPFGHYAKGLDYYTGKVTGPVHGLLGKFHGGSGLCGACGGKGCNSCGGTGHLLDPSGGCAACGDGSGGHGHGLFGGHKGLGGCGLCGGKGCGACLGHATTGIAASAQALPAPQVMPSGQCGAPGGCGLLGKHHHKGCGLCGGLGHVGGKGCGGCAIGDPCGGCGGKGCGLCRGGGSGCSACGGKGCGLCGGGHNLAGAAHGLIGHLLGRDKIKWFVGPGGPVPLTPGYTPYVNVTRSPRDFFAFPPMTP